MNKAIEDGTACEMPGSYVEKYLRSFVPERKDEPDIVMVRTMISKTLTPRVIPKGLAPIQPQWLRNEKCPESLCLSFYQLLSIVRVSELNIFS
jgi:hypothetical protein